MESIDSLGFESLFVRYESSTKDQLIFPGHEPGDYDSEDIYVEYVAFEIYGVPEDMDDADFEEAAAGSMQGLPHLAKISGAFIPCCQMLNDGEDPYTVCDDISGELEFIMSILTKEGGPLNDEEGDPFRDVFYIDEIEVEKAFGKYDLTLMDRVLKELPYLIRRFLHQDPQIIAYYPAPTKKDWYEEPQNRLAVSGLLMEKVAKKLGGILGDETENEDTSETVSSDGKITRFPGEYNFNEDDINYVLGRRRTDSAYPEELKDMRLYNLYEQNGFREIDGTRLLVLSLAEDMDDLE
jgi:hypothetical protein